MEARRPLLVEIRRGSLDDGPGVRTVVFFKGCPLRCVFCQNPEAQDAHPELAFTVERCIRCDGCVSVCMRHAVDLASPARIDRSRCDLCGACADACPTGALRLIGSYWPVERLVELLARDVAFYRHSGGGVTFSGGECTLFPEYLHGALVELKARGIHTAVETCGQFDYDVFVRDLLPWINVVFFDLKIIDPTESRRRLGVTNETILTNLKRLLAETAADVRPRVPLIPGITDSRENLAGIVDCLCAMGARNVSLLPYNPLGLDMYARLGRPTPDLPPTFTDPQREREIVAMFRGLLTS